MYSHMQNDTVYKDIRCSFICYGKSLEIIQESSNKGWLKTVLESHNGISMLPFKKKNRMRKLSL